MPAWAQDKIITNNGDTLDCRISVRPWKEKISIRRLGLREQNGYEYAVVFFPNDSIRIVRPGEVKGFFVKQHSKYLSGGYYETDSFHINISVLFKGSIPKASPQTGFLRRIYAGNEISLYDFLDGDREDNWIAYLVKKRGEEKYTHIANKKQAVQYFSDAPGLPDSVGFKKRPVYKTMLALVKAYEQLKSGQADP